MIGYQNHINTDFLFQFFEKYWVAKYTRSVEACVLINLGDAEVMCGVAISIRNVTLTILQTKCLNVNKFWQMGYLHTCTTQSLSIDSNCLTMNLILDFGMVWHSRRIHLILWNSCHAKQSSFYSALKYTQSHLLHIKVSWEHFDRLKCEHVLSPVLPRSEQDPLPRWFLPASWQQPVPAQLSMHFAAFVQHCWPGRRQPNVMTLECKSQDFCHSCHSESMKLDEW